MRGRPTTWVVRIFGSLNELGRDVGEFCPSEEGCIATKVGDGRTEAACEMKSRCVWVGR